MENLEEGPFFKGEIPLRKLPPKNEWIDFLGFKVSSRIGIPAGPLLNSQWIGLAADLGFDILTYKTIRSYEHPSHPAPNIIPVDIQGQLNPHHLPQNVRSLNQLPKKITELAITNSFGNPSRSPEYLEKDLQAALKKLHEGQVMIVSVFGSSLDEYVRCALLAKEWGAKILEVNYSCPNVSSKEGSLYMDPESVYTFTKTIVQAIKETPLVIKVGAFTDKKLMEQVLVAAAKAGARAVCGINTISMRVVNEQGIPTLSANRASCGICGNPIREAALEFTRQGREIIDRFKLGLTLMTTGGAVLPEHLTDFLNSGADIAMTATGMMWDPYIAYKRTL